jgi:DNA-binding beta-propeller fold protein YncE
MRLKNQPPPSANLAGMTCGDFGYEPHDRWGTLPQGWSWKEVVGVATDSKDRVFVFDRGEHPVMIFDRDGEWLGSWGEGLFGRPHGIFIGPDDAVYCTDDLQHTVRKFTPDGRLLLTLGVAGMSSYTGATSMDYRTILRSGPPFNFPTNLALSPAGDLYVGDGYGNARIHKFAPDGRLLLSWGEPGAGPGQFHVPHGIAVDRHGTVYLADRENCRLQLFSPVGEFISEWTDLARPCEVFIDSQDDVWVAELGFRAGMWPGTTAPTPDATGGRLSVFNSQGQLKARWGGGDNPCAPGDFFAPHDVWIDSHGDAYVSEVVMSAGGAKGLVSPTCHTLQKFVRRDGV